jgi:hypothetical protein
MTDAPRPDGPPPPDGPTQNPAVSNEPSDANVRGVVAFAAILAAVVIVVQLALWGMFAFLGGREDREKETRYPLSAAERGALPQTEFGSPATGEFPRAPRLEGLNLERQGTAQARDEEEEARLKKAMAHVAEEYKRKGHEPAPVRYDAGIPGTGGGSNSGRDLPEAKR